MDYKYTLIVSQYYHSYHFFIVKFDALFKEKAKSFIAELEKYKRSSNNEKDIDYGDLTYKQTDEIYSRYNVNDEGDVYFINSQYANYCMCEAIDYSTKRKQNGYIRAVVQDRISEHHSYGMVKRMVEKHFEIA